MPHMLRLLRLRALTRRPGTSCHVRTYPRPSRSTVLPLQRTVTRRQMTDQTATGLYSANLDLPLPFLPYI